METAKAWALSLLVLATLLIFSSCTPPQASTPPPPPAATSVPTSQSAAPAPSTPAPGSSSPTPTATPPPQLLSPASPQQPLAATEVVKLLRPSVVHIQTEAAQLGFLSQPVPVTGVGTGVVVDQQGHILTNNHVVEGAQRINVTLGDGRSFPAKLLGGDAFTDLAVLKIDAQGLVPAKLGDSSQLQVGEDVVAIGFALDLPGGPSVTKGVVSAVGRSIEESSTVTIEDLIQTDAAINPGNSGGPLANMRAEVVGINTAIIPSGQAIGFAIAINRAKPIMEQLKSRGFVARGYLGVRVANITPALAANYDLPVQEGVGIVQAIPGGPAAAAGLQSGDIIVAMDGQPITNTSRFTSFLTSHLAGAQSHVEFYRGKEKRTTVVTLGERRR